MHKHTNKYYTVFLSHGYLLQGVVVLIQRTKISPLPLFNRFPLWGQSDSLACLKLFKATSTVTSPWQEKKTDGSRENFILRVTELRYIE